MAKSVTIAGSKFAALRIESVFDVQEEFASRLRCRPGNVRHTRSRDGWECQGKNFRRLAEGCWRSRRFSAPAIGADHLATGPPFR